LSDTNENGNEKEFNCEVALDPAARPQHLPQQHVASSEHFRLKLLDVGCGTGAATLLALSHGFDVVATDLSEAMVERTKERAFAEIRAGDTATEHRSQSKSQLETMSDSAVAMGQDLPSCWSGSFDLAVANFSVIFFPQPVLGLREIFRCLVPGTGIASLTAWGDASETPAFRVFPDVVSEVFPELVDNGKPKRITGSVEVLTKLLEEAGFVDVRVEGPVFKTLTVKSPSEYYDRFALTSPPTAAMIAKMGTSTRSEFRKRIMEVATARGGRGDGSIALNSGAYIAYGRKPAPMETLGREASTKT
jgi:SAM-dependent methyltransferase